LHETTVASHLFIDPQIGGLLQGIWNIIVRVKLRHGRSAVDALLACLEVIVIVKLLLLALLAFAAVQQPNPPKPKRKRKVRQETPTTHEVFYQEDKHMTQEIEALAAEVKK
jgi:hypothetical protein